MFLFISLLNVHVASFMSYLFGGATLLLLAPQCLNTADCKFDWILCWN